MVSVQDVIKDVLSVGVFNSGGISQNYIYLPDKYIKILNPDTMLVEGCKGEGKSLCCALLHQENHPGFISKVNPSIDLRGVETFVGYSKSVSDSGFDKETLRGLFGKYCASDVWLGVVAKCLGVGSSGVSGEEYIQWVCKNWGYVDQLLLERDSELQRQNKKQLVVFDDLDSLVQGVGDKKCLKGLLSLLIEFRTGFSAIRVKAFVDSEVLGGSYLFAFADSSKILQNKVSLLWTREELYGILWQHLGNDSKHGACFRNLCEESSHLWERIEVGDILYWKVPTVLGGAQASKKLFNNLLGIKAEGLYNRVHGALVRSHDWVNPCLFLQVVCEAVKNSQRKGVVFSDFDKAIRESLV